MLAFFSLAFLTLTVTRVLISSHRSSLLVPLGYQAGKSVQAEGCRRGTQRWLQPPHLSLSSRGAQHPRSQDAIQLRGLESVIYF